MGDWSNDIHIGFQNGFSGHDDSKWEIVIGGWAGTKHVIRDGNASPTHGLVQKENPSRDEFDRLKGDFSIQVSDGYIGIFFSADESGLKGDLVLELNDERIIKSELNTMVATGGGQWFVSSGDLRVRGICS